MFRVRHVSFTPRWTTGARPRRSAVVGSAPRNYGENIAVLARARGAGPEAIVTVGRRIIFPPGQDRATADNCLALQPSTSRPHERRTPLAFEDGRADARKLTLLPSF